MTRTVLVVGTASHVGKSTVCAGLCRALADRGRDIVPYKAQNMSNNARAVPAAEGEGFGEIGVSQYVQARAAGAQPTTDHNPVLLKPTGDGESQLVIDGQAVGHFAAGEYYDAHWDRAREAAAAAHGRLAREHDVVVAEGAGSAAEINLHHRDLANVETARFADADVVLVADIERGGAFASLVGTLELMPDDVRERVVGVAITKFRGDRSLLAPGLAEFEERTGVPILGVLPCDDPGLPDEDSVSLPATGETAVVGADDGIGANRSVVVAVPRLPRISNFTDLEPLAARPGVRIAYLPPSADLSRVPVGAGPGAERPADAVVVPGTKNTAADLLALREAGFDEQLRGFDGPVVGLCGGYQLLGERVSGVEVESAAAAGTLAGVGLLPVETVFSAEKRVEPAAFTLEGTGPLAGVAGRVEGYEIHMGETRATGDVATPFARGGEASAALGAASGNVLGTYLHGLFENRAVREAFVARTFEAADRDRPAAAADATDPYDRAASLVTDHLTLDGMGL